MTHLPFFRLSAACCAALCMTACGTAPQLTPALQPSELPQQWDQPLAASAQAPDTTWWTHFESTQLATLVQTALAGSPDVKIAVERVRQAEAQLGSAQAGRLPGVGLGASTSTRRADGGRDQPTTHSESSSASLSVSYEVDLWGRVAAGIDSAQASLDASRLDAETARLTLVTGVANLYFQAQALSARLETARRNLEIAERVLKVVQAKNRYGMATSLDVMRQQTTVLSQRTALVPLETQRQQQGAALAVLLGRAPQGFTLAPEPLDALRVPTVAPGLPSDLLWRRPDLARTETDLRAAHANVQAARAALLPSFSLSGSGGLGTATLLSLANPSTSAALTASLAYTVFDGGRQRSAVTVAESQQRAMVETSRKTILTALREVEDALGNARRYSLEESAQIEIVRQSRQALKSAELRYREGVDDLLTVLDAQRTLFQAEDQLQQLKLSRLTAAVDLYKVLGGGWQQTSSSASVPAATTSR